MRLTVDEDRKIVYYYLRDDNVHIISMPHPTWMGLYSGFGIDSYVDIVIDLIREYKLHIIFQEHLLIKMENMPGDNTIFTI